MIRKSLSQDFESLFKDTEKNISSIKRQLGEHKKRDHHFPPRSPVHGTLDSFSQYKQSPILNNYSPPAGSSQTTLLTTMFSRIEEQSKTMALLEKMIHKQNEEIQMIKAKQSDQRSSTSAIDDSIGYDFQSKLELVERELRAEIDSIRNSMRNSRLNESYASPRNDILGDMKLQRRIIEDETKSLKREVDSLKNRVERVESDVNISARDTRSVNRKYGDIERDVSDIMSTQKSLKDVTERGENQLHSIKKELEEISSILSALRKTGSKGIQHLSQSKVNDKNHVKSTPAADSLTNTISILSISDTDSNNNLSLNSLDLSDIEKTPTESIAAEKSLDMKHTSLLDEDDDEIPDFNSCLEDENIFKGGSNSSLKGLDLSDEDSVTLDDLLHDDL